MNNNKINQQQLNLILGVLFTKSIHEQLNWLYDDIRLQGRANDKGLVAKYNEHYATMMILVGRASKYEITMANALFFMVYLHDNKSASRIIKNNK